MSRTYVSTPSDLATAGFPHHALVQPKCIICGGTPAAAALFIPDSDESRTAHGVNEGDGIVYGTCRRHTPVGKTERKCRKLVQQIQRALMRKENKQSRRTAKWGRG